MHLHVYSIIGYCIKSSTKQGEMSLFSFSLKVFADLLTFIPRIDSLERQRAISFPHAHLGWCRCRGRINDSPVWREETLQRAWNDWTSPGMTHPLGVSYPNTGNTMSDFLISFSLSSLAFSLSRVRERIRESEKGSLIDARTSKFEHLMAFKENSSGNKFNISVRIKLNRIGWNTSFYTRESPREIFKDLSVRQRLLYPNQYQHPFPFYRKIREHRRLAFRLHLAQQLIATDIIYLSKRKTWSFPKMAMKRYYDIVVRY